MIHGFARHYGRLAIVTVLGGLLISSGAKAATNGNRVTTKDLIAEPPTLISAGFEWYIDGDDNVNASVTLSYRKKGDNDWKQGLPLLRLHHEEGHSASLHYVAPNMFAGSLFDLAPDTDYECRFVMSDPDGVSGPKEKRIFVHTRPEPMPAQGGHVYHVYPNDWKGPMQEPNFIGLYNAYYNGDRIIAADHFNAFPPRVQPGDIILVHAGLYLDDRFHYGHELRTTKQYGVPQFKGADPGMQNRCCGTVSDGTYYLTVSGAPDKPIVIKAAGDGEVIFDGDGNQTLFNLLAANYTYFEGITFRNTEVALETGYKDIIGSSGLTVKHCRFENVDDGIHTDWSGSKNFYIADNVFIGKDDPDKVIPFMVKEPYPANAGLTAPLMLSQYAIKIYGSGHVVAFNRVRNFHDGIDIATYGLPDGYPNMIRDRMPVSNDFYNNDISNMHDDCVETDGSAFNMRVFRNRCVNAAGSGFSLQPAWGGPVYIIRNIVYHLPANFESVKMGDDPSGGVFYNNTFVAALRIGASSNTHYANNLVLAEQPTDPAFEVNTFTNNVTSDYNGFMPGSKAPAPFGWRSPAPGTEADYKGDRPARKFQNLSEFSQATGNDKHSMMITFDIFQNLKPVSVGTVADLMKVYDPDKLDFELKPNAPVVDVGTILPNITDGFTGKAPDLGALESGQPVPHYGPRP